MQPVPGAIPPTKPALRERIVGGCSIAAGAMHGGLIQEHFREWWGYGLFFVIASVAQLIYGLALVTNAINPKDFGPGWHRFKRYLYWAGIVGNLFLIIFYVITRTVGIPQIGPQGGQREEVAFIDIVSKVLEAIVVIGLVPLVRRAAPHED